jgi:predicted phosphodiesterase
MRVFNSYLQPMFLVLCSVQALGCGHNSTSKTEAVTTPQHSQQTIADPKSKPAHAERDATIEPYLLHLSESSAELAWRKKQPSADSVELICLEDGSRTSFTGQASQQQFVKFEGLPSNSEFRWEVRHDSTDLVKWQGSFRTLPAEPERRFAVVGHTHGSEHYGHYSDNILAARIAESKPQFLVHAGDCVYYSTPQGWKQDFFDIFRPVLDRAPIYISPGNHDSGWPFLDGLDLRPFQELFSHPFPKQILGTPGAAYYDRIQGSVHFLFLSYVTDLAAGTPQHDWIRETLRASTSEFNVVVLGGMNNYYDKDALRSLLSSERVDAVLRGDGSAPGEVKTQPSGYPIFSLGTANQQPHPWLDATATAEHLIFREMNAAGKAGKVHWIHSRREREPVLNLPAPTLHPTKGQIMLRYPISPGIRSDQLSGLQFKLEGLSSGKVIYTLTCVPKSRLNRGEAGFRSQYHSLSGQDKMAAAPIPSQRPIRGGSFELKEVQLKLIGTTAHPNLKVTKAWLY